MLGRDICQRHELTDARIGEQDVDVTVLRLDGCEETIEIIQFRDIALPVLPPVMTAILPLSLFMFRSC
jgi:hypothetical protein